MEANNGIPISRVYVAGYRYDVEFTRCCVASIREWNGEIPIFLIKDRFFGDYYTRDIENHWNVQLYNTQGRLFGWGFSKLEPLFEESRERFLVLDSDILVFGDLVHELERYSEDFVVRDQDSHGEYQATQYFDPDLLAGLDPDYRHHGVGFNTGQWVGTSGVFRRHDFERFVEFSNPPRLRHPDIFQFGEQGLLNYFLYKNRDLGRITVASMPFMEAGANSAADQIRIEGDQVVFERRPILLHWAGCRGRTPETSPNGRLFKFFADRFDARVPFGKWRRQIRAVRRTSGEFLKGLAKKVLSRNSVAAR